ncbi:hypothetical protein Barb6XT_00343 [Bacteroidales bacterium Barb6XT]|nr:hypothetical protein Barb6XT_00343 [Bacteroidales bacterium Barb6XT]
MLFTEAGRSIDFNKVQLLKALSGRAFNLFGSLTNSNFVQAAKQSVPIVSTELGISSIFI